jgi:hypothetical protein
MVSNYAYNQAYMPYDRQPTYMPNQFRQSNVIKGRPVSCFEEVKSIAIDWDGSLHVFPDVANKRIYTKQAMNDGTCVIKNYAEQPLPQPTDSQTNQSVSNKTVQQLEERVAMLEQQLKGVTNDSKSNATVPAIRTA